MISWIKTLGMIVTYLVIIYLAIGLLYYVFQRRFIYMPESGSIKPEQWNMDSMRLVYFSTSDNLRLAAWYHPAPKNRATIVYFHGNAGHIGYRAERVRPLIEAGYGLLLVEYRGYANNPGKPTEQGLYRDGRAAIEYLQKQGVSNQNLVILGVSLGSGVAVQMAIEHHCRTLVLVAPFTSLVDAAYMHYPIFPVSWLLKDRFNSADKIHKVQAPILILHGERDQIIPPRLGRQLYHVAPEPKQFVLLPGAEHNQLGEWTQRVIDFIEHDQSESEGKS